MFKSDRKSIVSILTKMFILMFVAICVLNVDKAYGYTTETVKVTKDKQVVDSFCGVKAYYVTRPSDTGAYSCAYYVKRFYAAIYDVKVMQINTYDGPPVVESVDKTVSLKKVTNPQPGDIMQSLGRTHVGIVKAVSGSNVVIAEQNWKWSGGDGIYAKKNRKIGIQTAYFYRLVVNGKEVKPADKMKVKQPTDRKVYLASVYGKVNLMDKASVNGKVIVNLPYGTIFSVTETKKVDGKTWGKVNYLGSDGWILLSNATYVWGSIMASGVELDKTGPVIKDISVSNISTSGYTVTCRVTDDVAVSRVQFPTWTSFNGQDDLASEWTTNPACSGTLSSDGTMTFRVKRSEHGGEYGTYYTHIYAYDTSGNFTGVVIDEVEVGIPSSLPKNITGAIVNKASGMAVTVVGKHPVVKKYTGDKDQQFKIKRSPNGYYAIEAVSTGKRMAVVNEKNGKIGVIFKKAKCTDDEYWRVYGGNDKYVFRNKTSNTVMILKMDNKAEGTRLMMDGQIVSKTYTYMIK